MILWTHRQQHGWFILLQPIGFVVFFIASIAELNRTPFDLSEAENELVAGYHVEYSGFRWAFFMLAEYVYLFAMSALITVVFLGGWLPPFAFLGFIPGAVWFALKFSAVVFIYIWLRYISAFPSDKLMEFGWKVLFPVALAKHLPYSISQNIFFLKSGSCIRMS